MRKFVEIELCKEKADLKPFKPFKIRLPSNHMLEEPPLNEIDDKHYHITSPEIFRTMNIKQIRYFWAMLWVFNQYLHDSIMYIDCLDSVAYIPDNSLPFTISTLLSSSRSLCLQSIKNDLWNAVLDKTSIFRTRNDTPSVLFERLKIAHNENQNE